MLILGGLAVFEIIMRLANRWFYMRARNLQHLAEYFESLLRFDSDGSAMDLFPPTSEVVLRIEKSSDDEGDYCKLFFSDESHNRPYFASVKGTLEDAGVEFSVRSRRAGDQEGTIVSRPIRSPGDAARLTGIVFQAVGVDADQGLRFRAQVRPDAEKRSRWFRENLGPGWWKGHR